MTDKEHATFVRLITELLDVLRDLVAAHRQIARALERPAIEMPRDSLVHKIGDDAG